MNIIGIVVTQQDQKKTRAQRLYELHDKMESDEGKKLSPAELEEAVHLLTHRVIDLSFQVRGLVRFVTEGLSPENGELVVQALEQFGAAHATKEQVQLLIDLKARKFDGRP